MAHAPRRTGITLLLRAATVGALAVAMSLPGVPPASALSNLVATKTTAQSNATPGNSVGYTIRINNPNGVSVTLTDVWDLLPSGFTYKTGFSTWNFAPTPDPAQAVDAATGRTMLTFTASAGNPFVVPAGAQRILSMSAFVGSVNGTYTNRAGADSTAATVTPTGDTAPVTVSGGSPPADTTPPAQVTSFTASPGNASVLLSWTKPADADFAGVKILYSTSATTPTSSTDGSKTAVDAGNVTSRNVTGLTNGVTYHFWAFSYDTSSNVRNTSPPHAQATPSAPDSTPPAQVTNLVATPGDSQVALSWTKPADLDLASVTILYSTSSTPPASVTDGAFTSVHVGNTTGTTITALTNDVTYHFWAFTRDTSNNVNNTSPPHASAMPTAPTPPTCEPGPEPTEEAWDNRFAKPGILTDIFAMATDGSDVYVSYTDAALRDVQPARNIARWDGEHWSALGEGANGPIRAIAVSGGKVYVGGEFTQVGCGIPASRIAMWDPETQVWSALGSGVANQTSNCSLAVWALAPAPDGGVYVGGCFDNAGGGAAFGIARWTPGTASWSALGDGVRATLGASASGRVFALLVTGDVLHVGGKFATAGGIGAHSYATWNNGWATHGDLGTGAFSPGEVRALAADPAGNVYAGGTFTTAGGVAATNVARYDGATWSPLGTGIANGGNDVRALAWYDGALWTGGGFTVVNGVAMPYLAAWDGYGWSQVRGAPDGNVEVLLATADGIYAGGRFWKLGGRTFDTIVRWDGADWQSLGQGIVEGHINDVARAANGDLYAVGTFAVAPPQIGHTVASQVARWNGSDWHPLGLGIPMGGTAAHTVAIDGDDVYVGGIFSSAGGVAAKNVARWNGTSWVPLGVGLSHAVRTLTVHGGYLYAGGDFTHTGDNATPLWYAARWNLASGGWSRLSPTHSLNGRVDSFLPFGGKVLIGGHFGYINSGGAPADAPALASYDPANQTLTPVGSVWHSQPGGTFTHGAVRALAAIGSEVYVAGNFDTTGGGVLGESVKLPDVGNIASFHTDENGIRQWSTLGTGMAGNLGTVQSLTTDGTDLFAGGHFTSAGGVGASRVARWSPGSSQWSPLGSGVNDFNSGDVAVNVVRADGEGVVTGGAFQLAGGRLAGDLDIYRFTPAALITGGPRDGGHSTSVVAFTFTANGPVTDFTCALDGAVAPCTSPQGYEGLVAGPHRFTVTATSATGSATASREWTVAPAPVATITGEHSDEAKLVTAWSFSSDHALASYRCSIDGSPMAWCASPTAYAPLSTGAHTFCVFAVDDAGVGPTTCDTGSVSPPTVSITAGPAAGSTTAAAVSFGFTSNHPGAGFECSLDNGPYAACTPPKAYFGLANGSHTFRVRAVDGSGTSAPATRTWTVATAFQPGNYVGYQWASSTAFPGGRLVRMTVSATGAVSVKRQISGRSTTAELPLGATDQYIVGVRRINGQAGTNAVVYVPTPVTSLVRTLSTSGAVPFAAGAIAISRDSTTVYFIDGNAIRKVAPTVGTPTAVLTAPAGSVFTGVATSANGATLYYGIRTTATGVAAVSQYVASTQTFTQLIAAPSGFWPGALAPSPDGRTLAIGWVSSVPQPSSVGLLALAAGGRTATLPVSDTPGNVSWRDDGTTLTVDSRSSNAWTRFNPATGGSQRFGMAGTPYAFPVDVTRVGRMAAPGVFTVGSSTSVRWTAYWPGQTPASYAVRYRRVSPSQGAYASPAAWQAMTATSVTATGLPTGSTYCYSVRVRATSGQVSPWSDEACTSIPYDDTGLTGSVGSPPWTRRTGVAGFWKSSYTQTTTAGARLTTPSVPVRQVMLIATTCATCGSVDIYWGTSFWKTVSLVSSTTMLSRRLVLGTLPLPVGASWYDGPLYLKARTSGKLVRIDGLALSPAF